MLFRFFLTSTFSSKLRFDTLFDGICLLNISKIAPRPESEDWCFVFLGRHVVSKSHEFLGRPWRLHEISANWPVDIDAGIPMGEWMGQNAWAFSICEIDKRALPGALRNLYGLLGRVNDDLFHAHGRAYQLVHWRETHRFCGGCGKATSTIEKGRAVYCEACSLSVYPRISPCIIVLVTRRDQMLLAAAAGFQRRFYSTLAGFIEPGETCEQAVKREVLEEVGVEVNKITYFDSQSWPFPSQLMLGFTAEWIANDISPDLNEIEDADWFGADAMPPTPPAASISGKLIAHHLKAIKRV